MEPDDGRVDRIQELGKFKMDYMAVAGQTTDHAPTERQYLEQNATKYPTLKPILKEEAAPQPARPVEPSRYEPIKDYQPPKYEPKPKVIEKEPSRPQEVERAKDHHQNTWQKPETKPSPAPRPVPQPVPRPGERQKAEPRKAPQPKTPQPGRN
jgi:hypothetical protein